MKAIIVDDEIVAINAIKRRVNWAEIGIDTVYTAESMKEAIDILENHKVDIMLCDIEMPEGNGLELHSWVRMNKPETVCIYVTCHMEYDLMREAMRLGSVDYVLKPIDFKELTAILVATVQKLRKDRPDPEKPAREVESFTGGIASTTENTVVMKAKRYIKDNISENITIPEIAEKVYLSPQYFMRLFKKETGTSVVQYITDQRIAYARRLLLHTNMSIEKIAVSVGYTNFSYFDRVFKRYEGQTPIEFRKSHNSTN